MDWYIGNEWQMVNKGLHKKVLSLQFSKMEKPQEVAQVVITVANVVNLNGRDSKYLASEMLGQKQPLELGTALTPLDCYVDILVQQMILGETAQCIVKTKSSEEVRFKITLEQIISTQSLQELTINEMYSIALRFKENGVAMFKMYPKFAHDYFVRGAKCLISFKPFDKLSKQDESKSKDFQELLIQIQTNLAACLLTEKRYEDVMYQTQFVETTENPSDKGVYRRALGFYHLKEYEKAMTTIVRLKNYGEKKEFTKLRDDIIASWKDSNAHYKQVVQRMFT